MNTFISVDEQVTILMLSLMSRLVGLLVEKICLELISSPSMTVETYFGHETKEMYA